MPGACPHVDGYNPLDPDQLVDPFTVWARARADTPVFYSSVLDAYVVTKYEDLCEILTNPSAFSSAGILAPLQANPPEVDAVLAEGYDPSKMGAIIMLDPPLHTRIRRISSAAFTPRRVSALEDTIRAIADELIDQMTAHASRADFVEAFAYPLPLRIILELLHLPESDADQLHRWSGQKLALQFGNFTLEEHLEAAHDYLDFQRYVGEVVAARRKTPGDDLISVLVEARDEDGPLEDAMVVGQVMGLINAGHETTTALLALGLFHLLEDRSQWQALRDDITLARAAVEEALRFDGPIKQLWRRALRDVIVGGVQVPAGARIAIALGSGGRDEDAFDAPETFDIHAKRGQHLAFSRGIHFCLGAPLARLEGRVAFEQLARRLPSLRLSDGFNPSFVSNVSVRMPMSLDVEWDR